MKQKTRNSKFFILGLASILLLLLAGQTLAQGTFSATGSMITTRWLHTATLLDNGNILLVGGENSGNWWDRLASAELYDPATGTFTSTGSMSTPREGHTATLLV
ncbi:MAG: kelch repeat-containing protein [Nitrospiraceae bacterium]|nr:kelch repeat-containing protein [Nitrospiraceae bacterium]